MLDEIYGQRSQTDADELLDTEPLDLAAMIVCVRREVALRKNVYPRLVKEGRMLPAFARRQQRLMEAVLARLEQEGANAIMEDAARRMVMSHRQRRAV